MPASSGSESATQIIKRTKEEHTKRSSKAHKYTGLDHAKSSTMRATKGSKPKNNNYIVSDDEGTFDFAIQPTAYYQHMHAPVPLRGEHRPQTSVQRHGASMNDYNK